MDREKVTKPSSQIGFIQHVLLPMFESLGNLFPVIQVSEQCEIAPKFSRLLQNQHSGLCLMEFADCTPE